MAAMDPNTVICTPLPNVNYLAKVCALLENMPTCKGYHSCREGQIGPGGRPGKIQILPSHLSPEACVDESRVAVIEDGCRHGECDRLDFGRMYA